MIKLDCVFKVVHSEVFHVSGSQYIVLFCRDGGSKTGNAPLKGDYQRVGDIMLRHVKNITVSLTPLFVFLGPKIPNVYKNLKTLANLFNDHDLPGLFLNFHAMITFVSGFVWVFCVAASGADERLGGQHPEEPQVRGVFQGVRAAEDVLLALHRLPPQTQSKVSCHLQFPEIVPERKNR